MPFDAMLRLGMDENQKSKTPEWEVLPPEKKTTGPGVLPLFKWLALIMDDVMRLPDGP